MEGQLFALFWKGNPKIWGKCRTWKIPSLLERELIETWKFQQTWEFRRYPNEYIASLQDPDAKYSNGVKSQLANWQSYFFFATAKFSTWESGWKDLHGSGWSIWSDSFSGMVETPWPNIINLYSSKIWRKVFDFQVYTFLLWSSRADISEKEKKKKHVSHSIIHHYLVGLLWIPTKMAIS